MTDTAASADEQAIPPWLDSMVRVWLRTPGLQRLVGRALALIGFHGHKTGRRYTVPVSYQREQNTVILLTRASRTWWRNLRNDAPVELRLAGRRFTGTANARVGTEDDLATLTAFLEARPIDARAHGVRLGPKRKLAEADARALLPKVAVICIHLS